MIDVIVTGQSLPALQTALDFAEVGLKVAVLPPTRADSVERGAERDPEGALAAFITRIAKPIEPAEQKAAGTQQQNAAVQSVAPQPPLLQRSGEWLPQSSPEVLGVPAVPLAAENIALLGSGGAFRAYLDRISPLLTVGKTRFFGELVRKRMGTKARAVLVDAQVYVRYGVMADEVEVAIAAPGLNEALSRSGALSSAVLAYADRNVARETKVAPLRGAENFQESVLQRLEFYGVELLGSKLTAVEHDGSGWAVSLSDGSTRRARALVADFGSNPIPDPLVAPLVAGVAPTEARIHAETDMKAPDWLVVGASAVTLVDGWAVSIRSKGNSQGATDQPSSRESPTRSCAIQVSSGIGTIKELSETLVAIHRANQLPFSFESLGLDEPAVGLSGSVHLGAAPFRTTSERSDSAAALKSQESEAPDLLPVGRAIHGDDQGQALVAAHESAVHLRRRLLGLED